MLSYEYLLSDIDSIKGIGSKTAKLFRKKNINTIFDLIWVNELVENQKRYGS